jgi:hypothetical protein
LRLECALFAAGKADASLALSMTSLQRRPFVFKAIGRRTGVAKIFGCKFSGFCRLVALANDLF